MSMVASDVLVVLVSTRELQTFVPCSRKCRYTVLPDVPGLAMVMVAFAVVCLASISTSEMLGSGVSVVNLASSTVAVELSRSLSSEACTRYCMPELR